jgi:hypothetical protein
MASFDEAVSEAIRVSRAAASRRAEPKPWWATVLFTRLCTTSVSLLSLAPKSRYAARTLEHYDCSAAASLARSVVECFFVFFYLCVEEVTEDEWRSRLTLLYLHDCVSRIKMFRDFDPNDHQLPSFEAQAEELRDRLRKLQYFLALPEKQRNRFLKGDVALFLSQDEILARIGVEVKPFRAMYRFLSSHVHSHPLAFSRMGDGDRGRGVESDVEKGYIATALEFAEDPLKRATAAMLRLFPDIPPKAGNHSLKPSAGETLHSSEPPGPAA